MKKQIFLISLLLTAMAVASAQELTPKQQYAADTKHAAARYADDKKLCMDEGTSEARLQCLRDAKSGYNKALATAKATRYAASQSSNQAAKAAPCQDCGSVLSVTENEKKGEGSTLGLIAGGVAGAVLGNQVGNGTGRDLATIAGAAGGAFAERKLEQHVKSAAVWVVSVQFDSGEKSNFEFDHNPNLAAGDKVQKSGETVVKR